MSRPAFIEGVVGVLYEVLGADVPLDADTRLVDLPQFDSVVLVEVVEALERGFDCVFDVELLVPETFETVETLAAAVETSSAPAGDAAR
jgi:acyl carrier protein